MFGATTTVKNSDQENYVFSVDNSSSSHTDNQRNDFLILGEGDTFGSTFVVEEVSLKWNVYDFSIDYETIDKSDILNNHKYLMNKNGIV